MQDTYEFLNGKLRSEKREENFFFFCKLKIKDGNVFYTDIYSFLHIYISIYIFISKKSLRLFNKTFSNYQATFSEHRDRLDPSPPRVCFHLLFKYPLPPLHNKPFIKKSSLEEMEGVNDKASAFMHLNIKINK